MTTYIISQSSGGWEVLIKALADSVTGGGGVLPGSWKATVLIGLSFQCGLTQQKHKAALSSLFTRTLIPVMETPPS